MAGIGDAWGTREELLHPRDKHGRFRSKWKMAEGVVNKITSFLSAFRPRTFQSDQQAAQYTQNLGGKKRFSLGEIARLHADFGPAQEDLRDGIIDEPSTKKFVAMMDSHAVDLPDDVIVSRVVGPDAFGLTAQTMNADDNGITDFTGKKIADRGYSATNLGTPLGGGAGQITMSIAVPKGTKAIFTGQGGNDRTMYLQRHQELRVTKVTPDGRGGYYMLAVAEGTGNDTPEPIGGHVGAGRPTNREGAIKTAQEGQSRRMGATADQPSNAPTPIGDGGTGAPAPATQPDNNAAPAPQQTLPDGTQPRTEQVVAESIGGNAPGAAPNVPAAVEPSAAPAAGAPSPAPVGPPLEDADVAKLRQRREAKQRYQAIADRIPLGNAGAEMHELVGKKASNKVIAEHIRAYANGPAMDEVHKDQKDRVRHELERVAEAFEEDKPTLGKQRMANHLKQNSITLQHEDRVGKNVDFDEATMESTGDIPENGQVEVIKPAVLAEGTVLEKAVVTAATKKTRKASTPKVQEPGAPSEVQDRILERARQIKGRPAPGSFEEKILEQAGTIAQEREAYQTRLRRSGKATIADAPMKAFDSPDFKRAPAVQASKVKAPERAALTEMPVGDDAIAEAARKMSGPPKNDIERRVLEEASQIGEKRQASIAERRAGGTTNIAESPAQAFKERDVTPAAKKAAPAAEKVAPAAEKKEGLSPLTKIADLRKIAADRGVDLRGARDKKSIIDRIEGRTEAPPARAKKAVKPPVPMAEQVAADISDDKANADQLQRWKDATGDSPKLPELHELNLNMVSEGLRKKEMTKEQAAADLRDVARDRSTPADDFLRKVADIIEAGPEAKKARAPRKAAAKKVAPAKAAPAAPEGAKPVGAEGRTLELDEMTKADLLARAKEIQADVRSSWTKDKIKEEIRRAEKIGPAEPGSVAGKAAGIDELFPDKKPTVADLKKYIADNNITVGKAKPLKADLVDAILNRDSTNVPEPAANAPSTSDDEANLVDAATALLLDKMHRNGSREAILRDMNPKDRAEVEAAEERHVGKLRSATPTEPMEDAAIAIVLSKMSPEQREAILRDMKPVDRKEVEAAEARHKAKMAARKAAPAKKAAPSGVPRISEEGAAAIVTDLRQKADARKATEAATAGGLPQYRAPEPAPGTAQGKITQKRLQPGNRILVVDAGDRANPTSRKMGATPVTIAGSNSDGSLRGITDDGKELKVAAVSHQTWLLAPPPGGGVPIKKVTPAKRQTPAARKKEMGDFLQDVLKEGEGVPEFDNRMGTFGSMKDVVDNLVRDVENGKIKNQEELSTYFDSWTHRMARHPLGVKASEWGRRIRGLNLDQNDSRASVSTPRPTTIIPDAPRGTSFVNTKERKDAFKAAWVEAGIKAPTGQQNSDINEAFIGIHSGTMTPEEGVTHIEDRLKNTQAQIATQQEILRSPMPPADRKVAREHLEHLLEGEAAQEKASKFLRKHFSDEAPVTPKEIKLHLNTEQSKVYEAATPDSIRAEAKTAGFGELKGDTKDELLTDLARKMIAKEKVAPAKKIAPTPAKVTTFSEPGKVDAKTVGTGIPFTEGDTSMLDHVQNMLDGTNGQTKTSPKAVGEYLETWADGPAGPFYRAAVREALPGEDPKALAEVARLKEQGNRWKELASRLKSTRRPAAPKKAANPEAAALHDRIASRALEDLAAAKSRDSGRDVLKGLTAPELAAVAKSLGVDAGARPTKAQLTEQIVQRAVGRRLDESAILGRPVSLPGAPAGSSTKAGPPVRSGEQRVTDGSGRIIPRTRPNEDEPIHYPNGGQDQGLVHLQSEVGSLWTDLYEDDREPNSFVNEIGRMGDDLGRRKIELSDLVDRLKKMKGRSSDAGVAARIQEAIDKLDAPEVKLPDFAPDTPDFVQKYFRDLAKIPTARRTGRIGTGRIQEPMLDRKLKVLKRMQDGNISPREGLRELKNMARDSTHEGVDGAYKMWDLEQEAFDDGPRGVNKVAIRAWLQALANK